MQKEWSKAISMLVAMETKDSLRRGAIMVIAQTIGLAHADLLYSEITSPINCRSLIILPHTHQFPYC